MCNVVNKLRPLLMACAISGLAVANVACDSEAKRERAAAEGLVAEAEALLKQANFEQAFVIMDSLDRAYPKQLDARREITKMRSQAMGDYAEYQIYVADSIIAQLNDRVETEAKRFKHIPGGDIPGYYVMSDLSRGDFMNTSGFEGRIQDDTYRFYIVANNSGAPIGIRQISVVSNNDSASTESIPADSDRAGETGKGAIDVATFELTEAEPLIAWLQQHADEVDHALLFGTDGKKIPYSKAQAKALIDTWEFAQMAAQLFQAKVQREKANRQLIIARDHSVNLE